MSMRTSVIASLSVLITSKIWVNCYVSFVNTQSAINLSFHSPVPNSTTGYSQQLGASGSCYTGTGKESHQVVDNTDEIWPYQVYKSSPFTPPKLEITTKGQSLAPGLLFITPSDGSTIQATKDTAPLIMTDTGQLVWNGPMVTANNLRVASYHGNPILTYWTGSSGSAAKVGHGYGNVTFLDNTYNEILVVCPQLGLLTSDNSKYPCEADLHESFVTDRNTLLVTAYNVTETDLSSIGGPSDGWVLDCLFFELDPKNGSILFRWSALEHIPVNETKLRLAGSEGLSQSSPFDWFHINSVVNLGDRFLVNSRHLWATYLITAKGDIEWTLQGDTGGDFGTLPQNGKFVSKSVFTPLLPNCIDMTDMHTLRINKLLTFYICLQSWQHFPRPHNINETSIIISYFNNFNMALDNGTHPSIGLALQLTTPPNRSNPPVVVDFLFDPKDPIYADSQGSTLLLPNGNVLMGYGQIAVMKEYRPSGPNSSDVLWTARFGLDNLVQSYRGFKTEWQGFPTTIPDLVVEEGGNDCRAAYVSWNGATSVEGWVVYEGWANDRLSQVARIGYKGFETQFTFDQPCVQVGALVNGKVSTRSSVVCTSMNGTRH